MRCAHQSAGFERGPGSARADDGRFALSTARTPAQFPSLRGGQGVCITFDPLPVRLDCVSQGLRRCAWDVCCTGVLDGAGAQGRPRQRAGVRSVAFEVMASSWRAASSGLAMCANDRWMEHTVTGVVRGNIIQLDAPVPVLEDRRVRVIIVPDGGELVAPADERARRWAGWIQRREQGPLDDEGDLDLP